MTGETIGVAVGEEFRVRLESSPTTGYVWTVQTLPESARLLGSDYEKPAEGIKPGDSVLQVFRFRALERGEHVISFLLKREWETDAVESHTVTVKVH